MLGCVAASQLMLEAVELGLPTLLQDHRNHLQTPFVPWQQKKFKDDRCICGSEALNLRLRFADSIRKSSLFLATVTSATRAHKCEEDQTIDTVFLHSRCESNISRAEQQNLRNVYGMHPSLSTLTGHNTQCQSVIIYHVCASRVLFCMIVLIQVQAVLQHVRPLCMLHRTDVIFLPGGKQGRLPCGSDSHIQGHLHDSNCCYRALVRTDNQCPRAHACPGGMSYSKEQANKIGPLGDFSISLHADQQVKSLTIVKALRSV